jgi:hypothetical protein
MSKVTPEQREKALRRPLPRTLRAWVGELEGVLRLVTKKPRLKDENGRMWWLKTVQYYEARLEVLADNPPDIIPLTASRAIVRELTRKLK